MKLHTLRAPKTNKKTRKRVGHGEGSGLGQQSGRGHKGQKAGSGYSRKAGFEGGQMPLQRRVPKFGFKNPFRVEYQPINIYQISEAIETGKLTTTICRVDLINAGLAKPDNLIKILGTGDITQKVDITADKFSKKAIEKIENAGGKANVEK